MLDLAAGRRRTTTIVLVGLALGVGASGGCSGPPPRTATTPPATASATVSPTPTAAPPPSPLSAAEQQQLAALAATAKPCIVGGMVPPEGICAGLDEWRASEIVKSGRADAVLIGMVGDAARPAEERLLAADTLARPNAPYQTDPQAAGAVLAAAEKQSAADDRNWCALGSAVGFIDGQATGLMARLEAVVRRHPVATVQQCAMILVLANNAAHFYPVLQQIARQGEPSPRLFAVQALSLEKLPATMRQPLCQTYLVVARAHDAAPEAAEEAATASMAATMGDSCTPQYDGLLAAIEGWAKGGALQSMTGVTALDFLFQERTGATKAQQARALAIAKTAVANAGNAAGARAHALRTVGRHDRQAKAFARRYTKDGAPEVAAVAKKLQK